MFSCLWVKRMRRRITTGWPWPCIQQLLLPVIIYLYYTLFDTWNPLIIFTLFPLDNLVCCYKRLSLKRTHSRINAHTEIFWIFGNTSMTSLKILVFTCRKLHKICTTPKIWDNDVLIDSFFEIQNPQKGPIKVSYKSDLNNLFLHGNCNECKSCENPFSTQHREEGDIQ